MTTEISQELFEHLVHLAALQLEPEEAAYLLHQLNQQLKAIEELQAIPVDPETPIASHGVPYPPEISQPGRADVWQAHPNPGEIIEQAPETDEGYIIVPEIPHMDL